MQTFQQLLPFIPLLYSPFKGSLLFITACILFFLVRRSCLFVIITASWWSLNIIKQTNLQSRVFYCSTHLIFFPFLVPSSPLSLSLTHLSTPDALIRYSSSFHSFISHARLFPIGPETFLGCQGIIVLCSVCVYMSVRALPPPYSLVLRSSSGPVTIRERGRERERIGGWEKDRDREKSIKEAKERKEPLCMCFSSRASVN